VFCEGKTRQAILAGTTPETMSSLYSRPHRGSIYEPASIHDIPQEVKERALIHLPRLDLVASSPTCRAWRPVAQLLFHDRATIDAECFEKSICRYQLNSLVYGDAGYRIATLTLELCGIRKEYIPQIAQIVAPSLLSLEINSFLGSYNKT
jgi:hypothetical protein